MISVGTLWYLSRDANAMEARLNVDQSRYSLSIYCDGHLACCQSFDPARGAMEVLDAAVSFRDALVRVGWEDPTTKH